MYYIILMPTGGHNRLSDVKGRNSPVLLVRVPPELLRRLRGEAKRSGKVLSAFVRELLEAAPRRTVRRKAGR